MDTLLQVIKGKAAALVKNLKVGDRIISANGVYLVGRSHDEVIQAMLTKMPDNVVTLELMTDKSPLHNPELRKKVVVKRNKIGQRLEGIGLKIHSAAQDYGVALGARISEVCLHVQSKMLCVHVFIHTVLALCRRMLCVCVMWECGNVCVCNGN